MLLVEDGVQGVIVPQRQPAALAEAIRGLLEDPARRGKMGQAAVRRIHESFDVKQCEAVFHERLFRILEARAASRRRPR